MPMWLESAYTTDSKSVVERHESSNLSMGTKKNTPQGVEKDERNEGLQRKGALLNGFEGILTS